MQPSRSCASSASEFLRRGVDIGASLAGLALLGPLFLLVALLIKCDSAGPVFYRATRVGEKGKTFGLYKFRSMVAGADKAGPGITAAGDRRITAVGRFLRRSKIDELPQLINVLRGEMSLVGPRPEDNRYVGMYTPAQREILRIRPGLTSPASLRFRHEEQVLAGPDWETKYVGEVMPAKIALDLEYFARRTFLADMRLIFRTIFAMFH